MSAQPLRGLVIIHITVTRYKKSRSAERLQITLRARLLNALNAVPVYTYLDLHSYKILPFPIILFFVKIEMEFQIENQEFTFYTALSKFTCLQTVRSLAPCRS